jgi:hypothetical protein
MTSKAINHFLVIAALVVPTQVSYVQASNAPKTVTVCDLKHFGAAQEGTKFRVEGIYVTDFRHFTSLTDEKNGGCSIEFGVKQSDPDESVARFNQAVVDAAMQSGPGIHHLVDAEVVFHWMTLPRDLFHIRAKSPAGVLELMRVFHSVPLPRTND